MSVSDDDMLVWDTPSGTSLTCTKSVRMEGTDEVAFTEGIVYRVASMHPIADPAYVKLLDDQGQVHRMEGSDLREYFKH